MLVAGMALVFRVAETEAAPLDLDAECDIQYRVLSRDVGKRDWFASISNQTFRQETLVLPADRDALDILLRRTGALLNHLRSGPNPPPLTSEFEALEKKEGGLNFTASEARRDLFKKVWRLQRRISLANPLLDFDRILFVMSQLSSGNHCCDQYFGFNACPGGSVYVLENAFSDKPELNDLLTQSKVKEGRLKGQSLTGGSFRSPELSFDGRTILFAYTECRPVNTAPFTPIPDCPPAHWNPGTSFHIFKLDLETPDTLKQLTDGPWNDFDPCFLPYG